jgi:exodeoxyribonuclease V alpha subunit
VLAALRGGPFGVENINRQIELILRSAGLISGSNDAYRGKPILVTSNDYSLRLFNGDIGILMPDPETGALVAWFAAEDGAMRSIPLARLPAHEPAFAMTVHKSQGSEFGDVLLALPDKTSRVLTRELLYTGLTRARYKVDVWFNEPVLCAMVANPIQRVSGLRARLAGK